MGGLLSDQHLFGRIDILIGQISGYLCKGNTDENIEILVSPAYTGRAWVKWSKLHSFAACTYNMRENSDYEDHCARIVRKDTALRDLLGEAMCEKADAVIAVWNEDVTELSGATWEFMRIAYERKTPCIWISTKSNKTFCLWESYYKKYSPQYLEAACEPLQKEELQPFTAEGGAGRMVAFWERRRMNYLKKYNADTAVHPSEEDYILRQDFKLEPEAEAGEGIRQILLRKFEQFDTAAILWNSRFQAMIYQSSVLPFIATIFLAVGSYVEILIGGAIAPVITLTRVIAGIAFFLYGLLNFYVYRLSKSRHIYQWQKNFVNDRYVAEVLRVLLHFLPYGVEINLRKRCAGDRKMYTLLKHLTDDAEPVVQELNRKTVSYVLKHVKEMLGDQIAYHDFSNKRYKEIVASLEKWGKRIFYVAFGLVLGCGMLQFILTVLLIGMHEQEETIKLVRDFFNMLALLLPAWAGYFFTKAQQNNFRYNYDNHQSMLVKLSAIQERVAYLLEQEEIPMEVFNTVVEELVEAMVVEDTSEWRNQYMSFAIKPL